MFVNVNCLKKYMVTVICLFSLAANAVCGESDVRYIKGLVVLVDFCDQVEQIAADEVAKMLNQSGYSNYQNNGSVKDYWLDVSGGKADYSNTVIGYYRAKKPKNEYSKLELMTEALEYAKSTAFDFSNLSGYGANQIESFSVMYAGDATSELSPMSSSFTSQIDGVQKVLKGHLVCIGSELSIGLFIHESGHTIFGMMDTYAGGYTQTGTRNTYGLGNYDVMADGGSGKNPVPPNPFFRYENGWLDITELTNAGVKSINEMPSNSNNVFICHRFPDKPITAGEYFLIEKISKTGRRTAMPGEGILVWHIDFTGRNNDKENWAPITIVEADNQNHLEKNANSGDQSDFFTTQILSDITSPNARWWDHSTSGLVIDMPNNQIVCTRSYDYNVTTPYGKAEIKYEPFCPVSIQSDLIASNWKSEQSPFLHYGEIRARVFSYADNASALAIVIYNSNDEVIKLLKYFGTRYATEMHLDAESQTLVITGQAYFPISIPLSQIAPFAFPPVINYESRASVATLIPAGYVMDYSNSEQTPYLQWGMTKVRVFSRKDSKVSFAMAFYNDKQIIKLIEYSGNKHAVQLSLDRLNEVLEITGQAYSLTSVPFREITAIAFPAVGETESEGPEIKYENRSSVVGPFGCTQDYIDFSQTPPLEYEQIPYLQYGAIKVRVFGYIDNRVSFAFVIYDKDKAVVKALELPSNRYATGMYLDTENQTLVIAGQNPTPAIIPLTLIAPIAFPPEIKFESYSSVPIPVGLRSPDWVFKQSPYLQYGIIKVRVFSYIDNTTAFAIAIYNKENEIIKIIQHNGNRYATTMYFDAESQSLVITGQNGPAYIPLSEIAAYHP